MDFVQAKEWQQSATAEVVTAVVQDGTSALKVIKMSLVIMQGDQGCIIVGKIRRIRTPGDIYLFRKLSSKVKVTVTGMTSAMAT